MNIQKITILKKQLFIWLFLIQAAAFAQAPTITGFNPTKFTQRTVVTINGTGFTNAITASNVKFGGVNATSVSYVSATQIRAAVPAGIPTVGTITVTVPSVTGTATSANYTYVAPAPTPATARVSRVITNWNGYWSSTTSSSVASNRPDQNHSLMAFEYEGVLYSTGSESAITSVLSNPGTGAYTPGNFRALPISSLQGTTVGGDANPTLITLGSRVDGNPNAQVPTAAGVAGLQIRDVLIDGIRGLDLGSGVTNLPSSTVMLFQATDILDTEIDDAIPDIIVSQIADPSASFDIYAFIDANGNIVGNPVQIAFNNPSFSPVGTFKSDFFTLPANTPIATAVINGSRIIGNNYRDIRLAAYKLSEFGINASNKAAAVSFKVMPSGTSDPAFMAYNRNTFQVPAPVITSEPSSQVACPGGNANFTLTVDAVGTEVTFQWRRNNVNLVNGGNISGAQSQTLSINPVSAADAGIYTVVVSNGAGTAISSPVYLNNTITSISENINTCINTPDVQVEVGALGSDLTYQWYRNTTNSNTGGTAIQGATSSTYTVPTDVLGNLYYYAKVANNGQACTETTSGVVRVNVGNGAIAGTTSPNETVCVGTPATISINGSTGTIQWQQSTNGTDNWVNVATTNVEGGNGSGTGTSYTTAPLTANTYYRAVVTALNQGCFVYSNVIAISVTETTTWNGSVNNLWSTPGNWSCNAVPTVFNNVVIPAGSANQPVVNGNFVANAKTITVQNGKQVTVTTGSTLRVVSNITLTSTSANLIVENNAALIQDEAGAVNTGNVTVKKNSNPLFRLDYTMWSSPVAGQQLQSFSPITSPTRFYQYNGVAEQYTVVPNNAQGNFEAAKGYLIRMPNTITGGPTGGYFNGTETLSYQGVFKGVPHNGRIETQLNTAGNRYTSVGNPYPSPISVQEFFTQNQGFVDGGTGLYLWRKKNDITVTTYATLSLAAFVANGATPVATDDTVMDDPSQQNGYQYGGQDQGVHYTGNQSNWLIAPGQGFLVKALPGNNGTNSLIFTNTMRRPAPFTGSIPFLREGNTNAAPSRLWLNLTGTNTFSQLAVAYIAGATTGLDYGYDAKKLTAGGNASLYSTVGEEILAIQARPSFVATDVVPLGFSAQAAGQYTVALDHVDGVFTGNQDIFLKDKVMGVTHDIKDGAYSFTTGAGTFNNRFEVVYMQPASEALNTDNLDIISNQIVVYKQGSTINITSGNVEMTNVTVFDIRGRKLFSQSGINATEFAVSDLQAQQQVLIVEIDTLSGKVSKKIIF